MNFSIIIPTYGNAQLVSNCISSLKRVEPDTSQYEIIVVDDGSPFNQAVELKKTVTSLGVKGLYRGNNGGFSATVNWGIAEAENDIIVLVNNDIIFTQPFLSAYKDIFLNQLDVGIVGALLAYPNQTVQHAGLTYDSGHNQFLHAYKNKAIANPDTQVKSPYYAIAVTGALFAFRKCLINYVGLFDEEYFLACEDTDYCLRAWEKGWKVLYTPKVFALHLEGNTRGNSESTKAVKGAFWAEKEKESIALFKKKLDVKKTKELADRIDEINNPPLKIEVGSGYNPHPGYKHLDVRKGLPELDYVCDFSKEKLPFKDGVIAEILANHVIEHISTRKLRFVVAEWARVLKPGGKLVLRTPNLRFICEKYLKGETTPEWPGDEDYIKQNLSDEITPSWWANLKLFSGQDYDANFHHVCFDFHMLRSLLERYGFEDVKEEKFEKTFSPGELQVTGRKAKRRENVTLVRKGALGDVLLMTPIIRRLKARGYAVTVRTDCPEALKNNTDVKDVLPWKESLIENEGYVERLDGVYELTPKMHIIDAYSEHVFGDTETPHELVFEVKDIDHTLTPSVPYIAIHMANSWENRTWSKESWYELLSKIINIDIVLVGSKKDFSITSGPGITNQVGKLTLQETAGIVKRAKAFIGSDSSLLHIAQAVGTPSVGIFTCARAEYRLTDKKALAVIPDIDCYGCLGDEPPPVTYCGCRRGDFKCLDLITPEMVYQKYKELNV